MVQIDDCIGGPPVQPAIISNSTAIVIRFIDVPVTQVIRKLCFNPRPAPEI
ncbi:hypothetical protein QTI24_03865 [Variovorax sp. J22P240]|uniref:hypothetical protein n=1 Tax=Variovorax sp. J22P240 TaxID=3053514 RepID=UPI0025764930|nr:hypothetical protein [Variovorax sp. J22P240]MDL9997727.1 hypothetical protein [Variovorax sp. J22P240]